MSDTLAQQLSALAAATTWESLPDAVRSSVVERTIDSLGLCLGALPLDTSAAAVGLVARRGGAPQAHIVGQSALVPAASAAFANGVLAHSLDYDDTHLPSILHPSSSVIPASLAVAEAVGSTGAQYLAAVAIGLEVCVRIGMAGYDKKTNSNVYLEHGQHATSICGTVGSAVAASMLLGLDAAGITDAIGVSVSMASGVIEANRGGGSVKRMHCGWAAQAGVTAAELVQAGFTGPPSSLEGRFGLFEAFLHGEVDLSAITDGLGTHWEVPGIFFKPYPANHFTHTIVDAAAALASELAATGRSLADIESIEVGVPTQIVRTVGEPIESKRRPVTAYQAQFSGPYAVALGLLGGHGLGAGLADYTDELAHDPQRRAIMAKVSVVADARCDEIYPYQFPAVIRTRLLDGPTLTTEALVNRGGPQRPLTPAELATKFTDNAERALSATEADLLLTAIESIAEASSVGPVLALTVSSKGSTDGGA
jgi:2-methylcitrate dehydratase PrpD